jgi:hypothetical protein
MTILRKSISLIAVFGDNVVGDPCKRLCDFDGPAVCTDGSWVKNGNICHKYVYRGDPRNMDYCYHTAASRETCPGNGAPVKVDDVDRLIRNREGNAVRGNDSQGRQRIEERPRPVQRQQGEVSTTTQEPIVREIPRALYFDGNDEAFEEFVRNLEPTTQIPTTQIPTTQRPTTQIPTTRRPVELQLPQQPKPIEGGHEVRTTMMPVTGGYPRVKPDADSDFSSRMAWDLRPLDPVENGDYFHLDLLEILVAPSNSFESKINTWRRRNGHLLIDYVNRFAGQPNAFPYSLKMVVTTIFRLLSDISVPKGQETKFAIDSGLSAFCSLHAAVIGKALQDFQGLDWVNRPLHSNGNGAELISQFAFARNLEKFCPNLVEGSSQIKGIVLAHRLYDHYIFQTVRFFGIAVMVNRASAFDESVNILVHASPEQIYLGVQSARFIGEHSIGLGPIKDWFSAVAKQIYNPYYALFEVGTDALKTTYLSPMSVHQDGYRILYEAVGRFLALAVVQGNPIGVTLPNWFFSMLMEQPIELEDIKNESKDVYNMLSLIMSCDNDEDLEMYSMDIDGEEIVPTMDNREEVVQRRLQALIPSDVRTQFEAIKSAFLKIIPLNLLKDLIKGSDLRGLVFGNPTIDVEDLIKNMNPNNGYSRASLQITWLNNVLRSLSDDQLKLFVRFLTSSPQVPLGGFAFIRPPLQVDVGGAPDSLPTTSTCFNQLHLPRYSSEQQLREKLLIALENAEGAMLLL